jgi:hypothetical protein
LGEDPAAAHSRRHVLGHSGASPQKANSASTDGASKTVGMSSRSSVNLAGKKSGSFYGQSVLTSNAFFIAGKRTQSAFPLVKDA